MPRLWILGRLFDQRNVADPENGGGSLALKASPGCISLPGSRGSVAVMFDPVLLDTPKSPRYKGCACGLSSQQ